MSEGVINNFKYYMLKKKLQNKAKNDFLSFVKCMWPDFIEGSHHRLVAEKFNKLATGEVKAANH